MKTLPHPTFGKWFQRTFLRAWGCMALLFVGALVPFPGSLRVIGILLAIGFGIAAVGTLAYLFFQLYHTRCPHCDQPMATHRGRVSFTATCFRCDTTWDLGIGLGRGN